MQESSQQSGILAKLPNPASIGFLIFIFFQSPMSAKLRTIQAIKYLFARLGVGFTSASNLRRLNANLRVGEDLEFIRALQDESIARALRALPFSKSQFRQDLFVLAELSFLRNGYFVEFGATNGLDLSNTYMLEKDFGWHGILAEPARCWHESLRSNRSCAIDTRCVWRNSGSQLEFNETRDAILSTLNEYSNADVHEDARRDGERYQVQTVSLSDLLELYKAPNLIDYLSIDTEGSEFDILDGFDFTKYRFKVITCEHNYTSRRQDIFQLLTRHGYIRKFESYSGVDDWYVTALQSE